MALIRKELVTSPAFVNLDVPCKLLLLLLHFHRKDGIVYINDDVAIELYREWTGRAITIKEDIYRVAHELQGIMYVLVQAGFIKWRQVKSGQYEGGICVELIYDTTTSQGAETSEGSDSDTGTENESEQAAGSEEVPGGTGTEAEGDTALVTGKSSENVLPGSDQEQCGSEQGSYSEERHGLEEGSSVNIKEGEPGLEMDQFRSSLA